jgi:hypothetical protein
MTQIELEKSNLEDSPIQANKKCATLQDETDKYTALVIELETKNRELKSHSTDAQGQADSLFSCGVGIFYWRINESNSGGGCRRASNGCRRRSNGCRCRSDGRAGVEVTVVQV